MSNEASSNNLYNLIEKGKLDEVSLLYQKSKESFNVTFQKTKLSPLILATKSNRYEIVKFFLDHGFDVNEIDALNKSALHHACSGSCDAKIVELLLSHPDINIELHDNKKRTAFHRCCITGSVEIAKLFRPYFEKIINLQDNFGSTPLHLAIRFHNDDIISLLTSIEDINVNLVDNKGRTPLHFACYENSQFAISKLLELDVKVNEVDNKGNTALHYACEKASSEIIYMFVKANANLNIKNNKNETPLHICIKFNNESAAHALITSGADVSARYDMNYLEQLEKQSKRKRSFNKIENATEEVKYDYFGFIISDKNQSTNINPLKEKKRTRKWIKIMKNWDNVDFNSKKLTKLIYKGIPNIVRPQCWRLITNISEIKDSYQCKYQTLLEKPILPEISYQIDIDINRSSRNHIMFKERYGKGQISLFNILKAYSILEPEIGYCQSMSDIGAFILKYFEEEEAFWLLVKIIEDEKYQFYGRFVEGFPLLKRTFYVHNRLLEKALPSVSKHLNKYEIIPEYYCLKVYMRIFVVGFNFEMTLRAWDLFLYEGADILYSLFITIISYYEKDILSTKGENILSALSKTYRLPNHVSVDKWIADSKEMKFKSKLIRLLEDEYMMKMEEEQQNIEGIRFVNRKNQTKIF